MIEYIFERVLLLSAAGTLVSFILLSAFFFTKKFFSSRWHYYTYFAALLVFLLPLSAKLPEKSGMPAENTKKAIIFHVEETNDTESAEAEKVMPNSDIPMQKHDFSALFKYGFYIWFSGFVFYLAFTLISYSLHIRHIKKNSCPADIQSITLEFGCRMPVLLKSHEVGSPMLTGIIKPVLFLPDTDLSDGDLRNILRHEYVHYKRCDIAVKWMCTVAKAIHWFNPTVFLLTKKIDLECEISCDISATEGLDKADKQSYCETILSLISSKTSHISPVLGMGDTKKNLERRFKAIMEKQNKGRKIAVISTITAAFILLCAFTASAVIGSKAEKSPKENKVSEDEISFQGSYTEIPDGEIADTNDTVTEEPIIKYVVVENNTEYKLIPLEESDEATIQVLPITDAEISVPFDDEKHPAVDYKLEAGTAVTSPIEGTIKTAEYDNEKGNYIEIEGPDGTTKVLFANLEKMYVNAGDKVNTGDTVGTVGTTGMSTGPHLHVEYSENGEALNPVEVFFTEENGEILALYSEPELIID